jgi:hypothetical protein
MRPFAVRRAHVRTMPVMFTSIQSSELIKGFAIRCRTSCEWQVNCALKQSLTKFKSPNNIWPQHAHIFYLPAFRFPVLPRIVAQNGQINRLRVAADRAGSIRTAGYRMTGVPSRCASIMPLTTIHTLAIRHSPPRSAEIPPSWED